jgi:ubiquinone/menaquinone biosynthesis C-methylase UbiE
MHTVAESKQFWNDRYDWPGAGDEWSEEFGGTEALWWFVLYPRIHRFLPAGRILEIAPGRGRWTQFLKTQCESLIAVDFSEKCIEHCKTRFASDKHLEFHVNDGRSLDAVADDSIDFAFSFDSLVHVEKPEMETYLAQLSRKLRPDGVGFIHHSNIGAYRRALAFMKYYFRIPYVFRQGILKEENMEALLFINLTASRASTMTAQLFRQYCEQAGLKCIRQELLNWSKGRCLIDSFSVVTKRKSRWDGKEATLQNNEFARSTGLTARLAELYCRW